MDIPAQFEPLRPVSTSRGRDISSPGREPAGRSFGRVFRADGGNDGTDTSRTERSRGPERIPDGKGSTGPRPADPDDSSSAPENATDSAGAGLAPGSAAIPTGAGDRVTPLHGGEDAPAPRHRATDVPAAGTQTDPGLAIAQHPEVSAQAAEGPEQTGQARRPAASAAREAKMGATASQNLPDLADGGAPSGPSLPDNPDNGPAGRSRGSPPPAGQPLATVLAEAATSDQADFAGAKDSDAAPETARQEPRASAPGLVQVPGAAPSAIMRRSASPIPEASETPTVSTRRGSGEGHRQPAYPQTADANGTARAAGLDPSVPKSATSTAASRGFGIPDRSPRTGQTALTAAVRRAEGAAAGAAQSADPSAVVVVQPGQPAFAPAIGAPIAGSAMTAASAASQIAAALPLDPGTSRVDVQLDPPELGRLHMLLDVAGDNSLRATLITERPATGDLLRRHADILVEQLRNVGFANIDLAFPEQNPQGHRGGHSGLASESGPGRRHLLPEPDAMIGTHRQPMSGRAEERLDLRL